MRRLCVVAGDLSAIEIFTRWDAAPDRFFELVDDHRRRKPHVVATLQGGKEFMWHTAGREGHLENVQTLKIPSLLRFIGPADDQGVL